MTTQPQHPYTPQSIRKLYLWWLWLWITGIPLLFVGVGILLSLASFVIFCILLYRYWAVIQNTTVRTSPGKAVGLCFIPLFNV